MVIYKTTNIINGKFYVGQDFNNNPNYLGSGVYLNKVIKKYGRENFKKEILQVCDNIEELNKYEKYWIKKLKSKAPNGYNLANGGRGNGGFCKGVKLSEEHKQKIGKGNTGKKRTEKQKRKYGESMKGKKHSEESKKKIGEGNKGKTISQEQRKKTSESCKLNAKTNPNYGMSGKKHSDKTRKKISDKHIGMKHTEESKRKNSESNKGRKAWNKGIKFSEIEGYVNPFKGKKHSDKTRKKISEAGKGRKLSEEHKNKIRESHIKRNEKLK